MKDKESLRGICGGIFISGKAENCYQSADVIKKSSPAFFPDYRKSIRFRRDIPPVKEGISNDRNCCVRNNGTDREIRVPEIPPHGTCYGGEGW